VGFGILQIASNLGYVLIADIGVDRPLMYAAMAFESLTSAWAPVRSACCCCA